MKDFREWLDYIEGMVRPDWVLANFYTKRNELHFLGGSTYWSS